MTENNEQTQVLEELLNRAKKGEHSEFTFLTCWSDLIAAKEYRRAIGKVLNGFIDASNKTYAAYLKTIKMGIVGLDILLSHKELQSVIKYYSEEYDISCDIISEYRSYIFSGHVFDFLLNNQRPEEDLHDFRYFMGDDKHDL